MLNKQKITDSLELVFARQEVEDLRLKTARLEERLKAAQTEIEFLAKESVEKSKRIRELEKNLLKFVEDFLSNKSGSKQKDVPPTTKSKKRRGCSNESVNYPHEAYPLVLYFIYCEPAKAVKIGYTSDIKNRVSNIQVGNPFRLTLLGCIPIPSISWEAKVHRIFDEFWITGEWFSLDTEIISCIAEVITSMSKVKPELNSSELDKELSIWIGALEESMQALSRTQVENMKENRIQSKVIAKLQSADAYLLSLPEAVSQQQKSLKPAKT
jgi:hypothetical protein